MKIVQVNCVYKKGSTGKIVECIHSELQKQGIESVVCYGRGAKINEPNVYKTCGELYSKINNALARVTGIMYGGCFVSTNKLISIIKKENPDVVHLHCINGYFVNIYRLIRWLNKNKIKTVLTLHAEFMYTANCGHAFDCEKWKSGCGSCLRAKEETKTMFFDRTAKSWKRMKKAFEGFEDNLIVTSVSPWLMERAKQSPILGSMRHTVVLNGLDTNVFKPYNSGGLKKEFGITDEKVIFHATPRFNDDPNHIKGGYYVLELAEMMKSDNVRFFIAGSYPDDLTVPENVTLLGVVRDQVRLAQFYSMADVTVLTSKKETFSMITAESLCCGTPIAGFMAGGPESIAIADYSDFVEHGDINSLNQRIKSCLTLNKKSNICLKKCENKYLSGNMTQRYIGIYKDVSK